jgi:hypothetical protein
MRKVFLVLSFMVLYAAGVFAGPPVKLIKVTVINKCEWDVPVGLGRDVNAWWFDEEEEEKLNIKRVPANGKAVYEDIQAGIPEWDFFVFNETTDRFQYKSDLKFLKDTVITITYDYDEMGYDWETEDDIPSR